VTLKLSPSDCVQVPSVVSFENLNDKACVAAPEVGLSSPFRAVTLLAVLSSTIVMSEPSGNSRGHTNDAIGNVLIANWS